MRNLSLIDWNEPIRFSERAPRPFPGLDPLRWYIRFEYALGPKMTTYVYKGKPCGAVAKYVKEMACNRAGLVFAVEFDQDGAIAEGTRNTPTNRPLQVGNWNGHLYKWYYPFLQQDGVMIYPWAGPMYRKKIIYKGTTHIAFDSIESWQKSLLTETKEGYKKWLSTLASR